MTEKETKNLLQLLCSKDAGNILLALQIMEGLEKIPNSIQFVLGLYCFSKDRDIALSTKILLEKFIDSEKYRVLMDSLVAFVKANRLVDDSTMGYDVTYHKLSNRQCLQKYKDCHALYVSLIPAHSYLLEWYLKAGVFWTYESKVTSSETRLFFEGILQFYPTHPYALFGLGFHYRCNQCEPEKAIEYYQLFLKHHSNLIPDDEMETLYRAAVFLEVDFPTTFNAYQHLAYLYHHQLEDHPKAIDYYWKAKKQSPGNLTFAYHSFAKLLWKYQRNVRQALEIAEEGLTVLTEKSYPSDRLFNGLVLNELNHKKDLQNLIEEMKKSSGS